MNYLQLNNDKVRLLFWVALLMRQAGRNASCVDGFWDQIYPRYFSGKCTKEYIFLTKGLEAPW